MGTKQPAWMWMWMGMVTGRPRWPKAGTAVTPRRWTRVFGTQEVPVLVLVLGSQPSECPMGRPKERGQGTHGSPAWHGMLMRMESVEWDGGLAGGWVDDG